MEMIGAIITSQTSSEKNWKQQKLTTKSKLKNLPKRSEPVPKSTCLEESALEANNFEVSDSEDDVTSKGVESSIGGNRVTSCKKSLSGSEFIGESTDVMKQTLRKPLCTIFLLVKEQALKGRGYAVILNGKTFAHLSIQKRFISTNVVHCSRLQL